MNTPFKYRAFISYSHSDEKWARWLHRSLETYRCRSTWSAPTTEFGPVPERFAPVFRDRDELATRDQPRHDADRARSSSRPARS